MKHWNKSKKARQENWHRIGKATQIYTSSAFDEIKRWCWNHPSKGRFYYGPYKGWWFEHKQDAEWFLLRWGPTVGNE